MSNRDGKPELTRIERMIEEESDPKQRAILVLLHYLTVSVSTSLDKLTIHSELLDNYSVLLNKANGASMVVKLLFGLTHAVILTLIIAAFNVIVDVRDTVTVNSVRISTLERDLNHHDASVTNNQKTIIRNQE